jgi:citrate lyase beta subunit
VSALADELDARLAEADAQLARDYPGEPAGRQPVHTVYVPADRYAADTLDRWRLEATAVLDQHAGTVEAFAEAFGIGTRLAEQVHDRVRAKLEREPVEDLRIDFEDGYGDRGDDEEDLAVVTAATALRHTVASGEAAPFGGLRFKSLEAPTRRRGLRTLELFVSTVADSGRLPEGLVVTLPKVTSVEQVQAMVLVCERLEQEHALAAGSLRFEIQVETPQAVLGADGTAPVARMIHASARRCTGLHYGTYDYSASCGIAAQYQSMEHPVADHAKAVMQVAAAGTGVRLSDGSTNRLPVGDREAVLGAWRLHARLVRRSLERGFYQGWDLHPAQLPSRYVAVFSFYREGLPAAAARLRSYVERSESGFLDEPATARALADFLVRAVDCGATDSAEVEELSGVGSRQLAVLARRRA